MTLADRVTTWLSCASCYRPGSFYGTLGSDMEVADKIEFVSGVLLSFSI